MRRQGVGPAEIGAFVGSLYLPWAMKWIAGPFVDVLSSDRFGRRRMWIVLAQVMMVVSLLAAMPVNFSAEIKLFTFLILIHNVFGATQDVAIDALAVNSLTDKERDVFAAVARGLSNTEIGALIFASESTVKSHVGAILRKLELRDRVQIVVFAYQHGLA